MAKGIRPLKAKSDAHPQQIRDKWQGLGAGAVSSAGIEIRCWDVPLDEPTHLAREVESGTPISGFQDGATVAILYNEGILGSVRGALAKEILDAVADCEEGVLGGLVLQANEKGCRVRVCIYT